MVREHHRRANPEHRNRVAIPATHGLTQSLAGRPSRDPAYAATWPLRRPEVSRCLLSPKHEIRLLTWRL